MTAVAEAAGIELSVAPYFDVLVVAACHFGAATPTVKWPAGASEMQDTALQGPPVPQGQLMGPPDGPEMRVQIDEDILRWVWCRISAETMQGGGTTIRVV